MQITQLAVWSHGAACECASPLQRACHGRFRRSSSRTSCSARELSLQLRRAESGSLTCLIAFDSSLSSPADQWSSALFIRNINVPHIPTGSAANPLSPVWGRRFILFAEDQPWLWLMLYFQTTANVDWKTRVFYFILFWFIYTCYIFGGPHFEKTTLFYICVILYITLSQH